MRADAAAPALRPLQDAMEKTTPELYDPAAELVEIATAFRHVRGDSKRELTTRGRRLLAG